MRIVNAKQFADETGYPLRQIRKLCRSGEVPAERYGKHWLFDFDTAVEAIKNRMSQTVTIHKPVQNFKERLAAL